MYGKAMYKLAQVQKIFDQATDEQKDRMQVETQALKTEVSLHKFTSKQSYLVMHVHNNRTFAVKEGTQRAVNVQFFPRQEECNGKG